MKIFNFSKFVFRLNVAVITVTFILLIPTTRYVFRWYPENEDVLKVIPMLVLAVTALLWLIVCYSIPILIRIGIFEERRHKKDRGPRYERLERLMRISFPIVTVAVQIGFLLIMSLCVAALMRGDAFERLLTNIL